MNGTIVNQDASASSPPAGGHRGFIYFCEDGLRYVGGVRAWVFFAPYLLGAMFLEPYRTESPHAGPWHWLLFGTYLIAFPTVWQILLRRFDPWRKRNGADTRATQGPGSV